MAGTSVWGLPHVSQLAVMANASAGSVRLQSMAPLHLQCEGGPHLTLVMRQLLGSLLAVSSLHT